MGDTHLRSDLTVPNLDVTSSVRVGDLTFNQSGGLPYGEIYATENATQTNVATKDVHYQFTNFGRNGLSYNASPSWANNHIKILKSGVYLITCSMTMQSTGGATVTVHADVSKNNGAIHYHNIHSHRLLAGGGLDRGSMSLSGLASLVVGDEVEVWILNHTNADNIVCGDVTLSLHQIGGN